MQQDFSIAFTLEQTPGAVFKAINDVRSWWTGDVAGATDVLGAEFTYRYADMHYSKHKITELIPGEKVVWTVLDGHIDFVDNKDEWIGTTIEFEIARKDERTEIRFTHVGLVPQNQCFNGCSNAWTYYINDSLRGLIEREMATPPIVSAQVWDAARQQLLVKEKAQMHARDALAAERRRMPWVEVSKNYEFEGPAGKVRLLDLFEGRRQLINYRAFFEPGVFGWPDHACRGCSLGADQVSHLAHLNARDTTLVYASRAPQADITRLKARMRWDIPWYTITDNFDVDFGVDEYHGHNVFFRDGDRVFRTYFVNWRGDEALGTIWSYLDITPLGRQETWEDSPAGYPQTPPYKWWNWHDNYDAEAPLDPTWVEVSDAGEAAFRTPIAE